MEVGDVGLDIDIAGDDEHDPLFAVGGEFDIPADSEVAVDEDNVLLFPAAADGVVGEVELPR